MRNQILVGDNRQTLKDVPSVSVYTAVTSPPYFQLRDYGVDGQIGLEKTPKEFIAELVGVFGEIHRILRDDGTCWINIGDSYASQGKNRTKAQSTANHGLQGSTKTQEQSLHQASKIVDGLKQKDLIGIPWMLAFALRDAGWYLRQDIIWHKPAPMPSSVKDRCTTAHEYLFLLSKSKRYYFDAYAISEKATYAGDIKNVREKSLSRGQASGAGVKASGNGTADTITVAPRRNKRSVWTVNTKGYKGAHFACYPPKLIEPCILAGSPEKCCADCGKGYERRLETERRETRPGNKTKISEVGDLDSYGRDRKLDQTVGHRDPQRHVTEYTDKGFFKACDCETNETKPAIVIDPFGGSGTSAQVAQDNGRDWIMCELNPDYVSMIRKRTEQASLF